MEALLEEMHEIQKWLLEEIYSGVSFSRIEDELETLKFAIDKAMVRLARTAKIKADIYRLFNVGREVELMKIAKEYPDTSHKIKNMMADAAYAELGSMYIWADRINAACTHKLDGLRSLLSSAKEEMRMNQFGGGGIQ